MGLLSMCLRFLKTTWVQDEAPRLVCEDKDLLSFSALSLHWEVQGITTSKILAKIPFWSSLRFSRWQEQAGSGIRLRCVDIMQKGTSGESGLADCITTVKNCSFSKIHVTIFFPTEDYIILSKKHSTSMKADLISIEHLVGYCDSNGS